MGLESVLLREGAEGGVELGLVDFPLILGFFEGISTSNLSDGIVVIHVPEDKQQKVGNWDGG